MINITTVGKNKIQLSDHTSLSITNFDRLEENGHQNWKTKLVAKHGDQIVSQVFPIMKDYDENYFYYFVPLKINQYISDLNRDGELEFAIAVDHGGNAPYTSAVIFTLIDDHIRFYRKAWFKMDGGREIMWEMPNDSK